MALKAYNAMKASAPEILEQQLFNIQQQAAVLAALCATVFAVIAALKTAKAVAIPGATALASPLFGTKTAASSTGAAVAVS